MTYRRVVWGVIVLLALVVASLGGTPGAQASPPAQGNLLENPGFEDPFVPFQGDTTRLVAHGWSAWHIPQREGDEGFRNLKPEYQPVSANTETIQASRIREGANAQEYFSFFATHTGGVYQQVTVPVGSRVQFSVFVYVWSTRFDDVNRSEDPGRVQVRVGIDPTGGTDGESERIIWSQPLEFYDEYRQVSVETNADDDLITVFVRTSFDLPQKNNNIYLDQASLTVMGAALPSDTPTATPTHTPTATATLTPPGFIASPTQDVLEQDTATPTPTRTPIPGVSEEFPEMLIHRVVAGDTVGALAQRYGSTVSAIIAANDLNSDALIFVDDNLIIPVRALPEMTATPYPTPLLTQVGILPTRTLIPPAGATATPQFGTGGPVATTTYVIQRGDTLSQIASFFNTSVAALVQLNGIVNPDRIQAGQAVSVPATAPPAPVQPTAVPVPARPRTHVVRTGENAFRISLRYGVSLEALVQTNNIANANVIYAGQVLTIP